MTTDRLQRDVSQPARVIAMRLIQPPVERQPEFEFDRPDHTASGLRTSDRGTGISPDSRQYALPHAADTSFRSVVVAAAEMVTDDTAYNGAEYRANGIAGAPRHRRILTGLFPTLLDRCRYRYVTHDRFGADNLGVIINALCWPALADRVLLASECGGRC